MNTRNNTTDSSKSINRRKKNTFLSTADHVVCITIHIINRCPQNKTYNKNQILHNCYYIMLNLGIFYTADDAKSKTKSMRKRREIAAEKRDYKTAAETKTYESQCDNKLLSTLESGAILTKWWICLCQHVTTAKPKSAFRGIFNLIVTLTLHLLTPKFDAFILAP